MHRQGIRSITALSVLKKYFTPCTTAYVCSYAAEKPASYVEAMWVSHREATNYQLQPTTNNTHCDAAAKLGAAVKDPLKNRLRCRRSRDTNLPLRFLWYATVGLIHWLSAKTFKRPHFAPLRRWCLPLNRLGGETGFGNPSLTPAGSTIPT